MEMKYKIPKTASEQKATVNCHIEIQILEKISIYEKNVIDYGLWREAIPKRN